MFCVAPLGSEEGVLWSSSAFSYADGTSPLWERTHSPGMQKRKGLGPEPQAPPLAPHTLVSWSQRGQMRHQPGRGPGNMLKTRCCHGALPFQVSKLHTKHKQSPVCLSPIQRAVCTQGTSCPLRSSFNFLMVVGTRVWQGVETHHTSLGLHTF